MMNITNAISRFTGNENVRTVFEEPFMMGLKISNRSKTSAIRIGINFQVNRSTEELTNTTRTSRIESYAPLLGYEWRRSLGNHCEIYGGIDARYYNDLNKTETVSINNGIRTSSVFRNSQQGFGGGPHCGFQFHVSPRISFLTEGNFYINIINSRREFSSNGAPYETFENKQVTNFSPYAPSALFILIRL
jgi:hypothetical protein